MKDSIDEHFIRINNAIDYIENHLDQDLSVPTLADVSCYSTFHFHRVFTELVGETPAKFILRKRHEKIVFFVLKNKDCLLKDITLKYGFNSSAAFAKSFKKIYGINATGLREKINEVYEQVNVQNSKIGQLNLMKYRYSCNSEELLVWMKKNGKFSVQDMEPRRFAYIRKQGEIEKAKEAFMELRNWVDANHLVKRPQKNWTWIIHDNPAITEVMKLSHSACFHLNDQEKVPKNINTLKIPRGRFAVGTFDIYEGAFKKAWESISLWIMREGHVFRDGIYHETQYTDSIFEHQSKHKVDLCIPIE